MRRAAVGGAGGRGEGSLGAHAVICAIPPPMTPPPMMPMDLTPGKSVLLERSLGGVLNSYASSDEACAQTRHAAQSALSDTPLSALRSGSEEAREAEQKRRR